MVKDRDIVSIKVVYEVICALSNGGITPLTVPKPPHFFAFSTAIHSFVTGERLQIWYIDLP